MATPRIPNQKRQYNKLNERLAKYVLAVQSIYDDLNSKAAKIGLSTGYDGEGVFRFSDYPDVRRKVQALQEDFVTDIGALIMRGTSEEWKNSNLAQDMIADKALMTYTGEKNRKKYTQYYQANSQQLKAFQQRKDRGMNLSAKLWNQSEEYKKELEAALSVGIERGTDAVTLSKRLSKYLNDFESLKDSYKEKFGNATLVHDCEYRSVRLARSEINMAYRTAEQERWRQFDFVVGYEIKLSGSHPKEDICDRLAGKYPNDFEWTGWHPNDICYCVPLLKTEEEFFDDRYDEEHVQMEIISGGKYAEKYKSQLEKLCDEFGVRVRVEYTKSPISGQGSASTYALHLSDEGKISGRNNVFNGDSQETIATHEFGHWLCSTNEKKLPPYDEWIKTYAFPNNKERARKAYDFFVQRSASKREHQPDGLSEALMQIRQESYRTHMPIVSRYAGKNEDEWIAENFAFGYFFPGQNKTADRVVDTMREFYANRRKDSISILHPQNEVLDVPLGYKQYIYENRSKIIAAQKSNTVPYFIRDNYAYADGIINHGIQVSNENSEFVMTESMAQNLLRKGWNKIDADTYNVSTIRGFDLLGFNDDVDTLLAKCNSKAAKNIELRIGKDTETYVISSAREKGVEKFHLTFDTYTRHDGRYMAVREIWLTKSYQGKKIADPVLYSLFDKMRMAGVDFVEIPETTEIGGYFWARCGMKCEEKHFDVLVELLNNKAKNEKERGIVELIQKAGLNAKRGDYIPMDVVAQIEGAKELLIGQTWTGILDLQDERQWTILAQYLNR